MTQLCNNLLMFTDKQLPELFSVAQSEFIFHQ